MTLNPFHKSCKNNIPAKNEKDKCILCHAPFKSLRFGPGGRITVCCHNHSDIVGIYPKQSLTEIWNSEKMEALRKTFISGKLSGGCVYCISETKNFKNEIRSAALYDRYHAFEDQPVILDFKTDDLCNLSCIMCSGLSSSSIRENKKLINNPFHNEDFFNEIKAWAPGIAEARFSGGEPFLSDFYFRIWEMLTETNPACKIFVQTNGTILNTKVTDLLEKGNFNINISVDSFNDELYGQIRKGSSLQKLLPNLDWFRDYCKLNDRFFGITSCAMQSNIHEIPSIIRKWNELGAQGWLSVVWFPAQLALWSLTEKEILEIYQSFSLEVFPESTEIEKYNKKVFGLFMDTLQQIMIVSEKHHKPAREALCKRDDFISLLLSLAGIDENYSTLKYKINNSVPGDTQTMFNAGSLREIMHFASPALLGDLLEIMKDKEITENFKPFICINKIN
jgi:MoaA/NifB/PqqE/SkfB family radical SAM enzyme